MSTLVPSISQTISGNSINERHDHALEVNTQQELTPLPLDCDPQRRKSKRFQGGANSKKNETIPELKLVLQESHSSLNPPSILHLGSQVNQQRQSMDAYTNNFQDEFESYGKERRSIHLNSEMSPEPRGINLPNAGDKLG